MLGSMNSDADVSSGPNKPLEGRVYRYGRRVECELCQTVQQCVDRYGMVTCQECQTEFLPSSGGVLYMG